MSLRAGVQICSVRALCRSRVRGTAIAAAVASGTIDWALQAETSQFRAPVSRNRLGLLSYKILQLYFSHLLKKKKKKRYFSFPRQMFSKTNFKIHGWKRLEEKQIVCVTSLELLRVAFLNHGTIQSLSVLLHGLRPSHSFTAVKIRSLRMTAHLKCDCCKLLITFIHKHDSVFLSYLCYSSEHVAYSLFYWQSALTATVRTFESFFVLLFCPFPRRKNTEQRKKPT